MTIYIDSDFRCYTSDAFDRLPVETDAFNGKCRRYIEGYRFVPTGSTWTREDGEVFAGEMITPAEDIRILEAAQGAYEEAMVKVADMQAALDAIYSGEVIA